MESAHPRREESSEGVSRQKGSATRFSATPCTKEDIYSTHDSI